MINYSCIFYLFLYNSPIFNFKIYIYTSKPFFILYIIIVNYVCLYFTFVELYICIVFLLFKNVYLCIITIVKEIDALLLSTDSLLETFFLFYIRFTIF